VGTILKMDLSETGWDFMYWTNLAQGRDRLRALVKTVIKFFGSIKFETFLSA
jgi:hypothetical protein